MAVLVLIVNLSNQCDPLHFILRKGIMCCVLPVKATAVCRIITWKHEYSYSVLQSPGRWAPSRTNYSNAGSVSPSSGILRHHIAPRLPGIFEMASPEVY